MNNTKKSVSIGIISALLLVTLSGCTSTENIDEVAVDSAMAKAEAKEVSVKVVEPETIEHHLYFTGYIEAGVQTTVASEGNGRVLKADFETGDEVTTGQKLVYLDQNNIRTAYNNANNAYQNAVSAYNTTKLSAQKDLKNARISIKNAEIALNTAKKNKDNTYASMEKQVEMAEIALSTTKKSRGNVSSVTDEQYKSAEIAVETAEISLKNTRTNYDNLVITLEQNTTDIYKNAVITLGGAIIAADSHLNTINNIVGQDTGNKDVNDTFEKYLGALNQQSHINAKNDYNHAIGVYNKLLKKYEDSKDILTDEQIEELLNDSITTLNTVKLTLDDTNILLDNTVTAANFPQSSLDGLKTQIVSAQGSITTAIANIQVTINGITSLKISKQTQLDATKSGVNLSKKQLDTAKQALNNLRAGNTSQLDTVDSQVQIAEIQLESAKIAAKTARDSVDSAVEAAEERLRATRAQLSSLKEKTRLQVTAAKTQLDLSKGQLNMSKIQLDNTIVKAPLSGIILSKKIEVGTLVGVGTPIAIVANVNTIKIKANVTEKDLGKIFLKKKAFIEIDAYPEKIFEGIVTKIAPAADQIGRKFPIEITVDNQDQRLKPSMFAKVAIEVKKKLNVLKIPYESIVTKNNVKQVFVVTQEDTVEMRTVKTGLHNETEIEITAGLKNRDKVVIEGILGLAVGNEVIVKKEKKDTKDK